MTKLQEALRLSEEAFMKIADLRNLGKIQPEVIAFETLYTIREALQKQKNDPVCSVCCKPHDKDNPVGYFLPPANELDSWEQLAACDDPDSVPIYAGPQPDMNLNCKSVQARLATSWGYAKASQEPIKYLVEATCTKCGATESGVLKFKEITQPMSILKEEK